MLRRVKPFNERDWAILMEHLKRGPTKEQAEFVEKCRKMKFNEVKPKDSSD